ncbi:MAG: hypothetical protein RJA57_295 [Bacteroidota bacterium]
MKPVLFAALFAAFIALLPGCQGNTGSDAGGLEESLPVEVSDSSVSPESSDTLILPRTDTLSETRRVAFPDKRMQ